MGLHWENAGLLLKQSLRPKQTFMTVMQRTSSCTHSTYWSKGCIINNEDVKLS